MTVNPTTDERELSIERIIAAPPELLFRCWTEPELMKQWFCPQPWTTPVIEVDLRPGGTNFILMRGPEGEEHPNHGVYLEIVPGRRLVMTDAFTGGWVPSARAFLVIRVSFDPEGEGATRYRASALHWTLADKVEHEAMGFHAGWGKATDQLEELALALERKPQG
jgi:uncharacterized protein YndB with AHSA1/START domain